MPEEYPVGEGESKDVDTGHASLQDLVAIRGRSDGGYDSRASHVVPFVTLTSLSDGQRAPNSVTVRSRCS